MKASECCLAFILLATPTVVLGQTMTFVNVSSQTRPVFVVNFDIASVICQHSADPTDLHVHPIAILCDKKVDCYNNPSMNDESFPYCSGNCTPGCSPNGTCLKDHGSSHCYCNEGYIGPGCSTHDHNECEDKPCSWMARCTNTKGSYYCTCMPGFYGDGFNCTDIDECKDPRYKNSCPSHSECVNIPGSYFCNCSEGFIPKGNPTQECIDIDECQMGLHHCTSQDKCKNEKGRYKCDEEFSIDANCQPGYRTVNGACKDIDECKEKNDCDVRAKCLNTPGSYSCHCEEGFTGDGKDCTPTSDCSDNAHICDKNAYCIPSLRMCFCHSGYIGDGFNCFDMNECLSDLLPCGANETCINMEGSYICCPEGLSHSDCKQAESVCKCGANAECSIKSQTGPKCTCKAGFKGDPLKGCIAKDCRTEPSICGNRSLCLASVGICGCSPGYTGDGVTCSDVNECSHEHQCQSNSTCVNTEGGFICCSKDKPSAECLHALSANITTSHGSNVSLGSVTVGPGSHTSLASVSTSGANSIVATTTIIPPGISTTPASGVASTTATASGFQAVFIGSTVVTSTSSSVAGGNVISSTAASVGTASTSPVSGVTTQPGSATNVVGSGVSTTLSFQSELSGITPISGSSHTPVGTVQHGSSTVASDSIITGATFSPPVTVQTGSSTPSSSSTVTGDGRSVSAVNTNLQATTTPSSTADVINAASTQVPTQNGSTGSASTISGSSGSATVTSASNGIPSIGSGSTGLPSTGSTSAGSGSTGSPSTTSASIGSGSTEPSSTGSTSAGSGSVKADSTGFSSTTTASSGSVPVLSTTAGSDSTGSSSTGISSLGTNVVGVGSTEGRSSGVTSAGVTGLEIHLVTTQIPNGPISSSINSVPSDPNVITTVTIPASFLTSATQSGSGQEIGVTHPIPTKKSDEFLAVNASSQAVPVQPTVSISPGVSGTVRSENTTAAAVTPVIPSSKCKSSSDCGPDTICDNDVCRCRTGFIGGPPQKPCTDVDECAFKLHKCELGVSECHNYIGGYSCLCKPGYRQVGTTCMDINECLTLPCHPEANCKNFPGSFECHCKEGFVGNGLQCAANDTQSCSNTADRDKCGPNAECLVHRNGLKECQCQKGFVRKNDECVDVDECKQNICAANADCTNSIGSFNCTCKRGFAGDGVFVCEDINECIGGGICHQQATCLNNAGSFICQCNEGLVGDGIHVCNQPENSKCSGTHNCSPNAFCLDRDIGYICECKLGFRGDGVVCTDINECLENRHACDLRSSTCENRLGSYQCLCNPGFIGAHGFCLASNASIPTKEVDYSTLATSQAVTSVVTSVPILGSTVTAVVSVAAGSTTTSLPINSKPSCPFSAALDCHGHQMDCILDLSGSPVCINCPINSAGQSQCQELNECGDGVHSCSEFANCTTTEGRKLCECHRGYEGDGKNCTKINVGDCADPQRHNCSIHADCIAVEPSGHVCTCNKGFIGDGSHCDDVDECFYQNVCSPHANCTNTIGSYQCRCLPGYIGNGFICTAQCPKGGIPRSDTGACSADINNCPPGFICYNTFCCPDPDITNCILHPGACSSHARCQSGKCICQSGFEGNGTLCTDVNECDTTLKSACDTTSTCVNLVGGFVCCKPDQQTSECASLRGTSAATHSSEIVNVPTTEQPHTTVDISIPVSLDNCTLNAKLCDPNAQCIQGSCMCNLGFYGSGHVCTGDPQDCMTNTSVCGGNAVCSKKSRRCFCQDGYSGDPYVVCEKTDESDCVANVQLCGPLAFCNETVRHCQCRSGYLGDGLVCRPDPQDCTVNTTLCHANAECLQLMKRCRCNLGYSGDGLICTADPDDCVVNKTLCSTYGKCTDRRCQCNSGFSGSGKICEPLDKDDCGLIPAICDPLHSRCTANRCVCDKGYLGDGKNCTSDPTNCAINAEICHLHAICENEKCHCDTGYSGNGTACEPLDPRDCSVIRGLCHANGICNGTDRRCHCNEGYYGDGVANCTIDTDDCVLNLHICDVNAVCSTATRRCHCKEAYWGNGKSCLASDTNDCELNFTICDPNATCKSRRCSCNQGYKGDGKHCQLDAADCVNNRQICSSDGFCDFDARNCKCNPGYTGNGQNCTLIDRSDCVLSASICHSSANCNVTTRRCECAQGYLGNGSSCEPDSNDCGFGSAICHQHADCLNRRCHCRTGYTGDGKFCSAVVANDCSVSPSICDRQAECHNGKCACKAGYRGDGFHCDKADADDCQFNSNLCDRAAGFCNVSRCQCKEGFKGDGKICSPVDPTDCSYDPHICGTTSTCKLEPKGGKIVGRCYSAVNGTSEVVKNPYLLSNCSEFERLECHPNASCFKNATNNHTMCTCGRGFSGDGKDCSDFNECLDPNRFECHKLALCENTIGSYSCRCPTGFYGDGFHSCVDKNQTEVVDVQCEGDGLMFVLTEREGFGGRIFVKSQSKNPYCSKDFNETAGPVYRFKAPFNHCDVKKEAGNTFSVVIVIQKHPFFITDSATAYNLRCTYPTGEKMVTSHFDVNMLSTDATLTENGPMGQCSLKIVHPDTGLSITEAVIGQQLQARISVQPASLYGLIAKNCIAVNMDDGETYKLTDNTGCAVDDLIFPDWQPLNDSILYSNFMTFKWPDTAHIRFQCDCATCVEKCPPVQCRGRDAHGKRRRDTNAVRNIRAAPVYSGVLAVRELEAEKPEEEDLTDPQATPYTGWMYEYEGEICLHTATFSITLALAVCMAVAFTTVGFIFWIRRSAARKSELISSSRQLSFGFQSASTMGSSPSAIGSSMDSADYQNLGCNRTVSDLSVHSRGSNDTLDAGERRKYRLNAQSP